MEPIIKFITGFFVLTIFTFLILSTLFIILRYAVFLAKEMKRSKSSIQIGFNAFKFILTENASEKVTYLRLLLVSAAITMITLIYLKIAN